MKQYLDLVNLAMETGVDKTDRTGTGTRSIFGHQMRFDLQKEFPIVKAKFTAFRLVVIELIWLLSGSTNIKFLTDNNCHIWDEWADENGDLGPVYGAQWRKTRGKLISAVPNFTHKTEDQLCGVIETEYDQIDQIQDVINQLKNNPDGRRIIVSAWNVADIPDMALPPCHAFFQFYAKDLTLAQRRLLFYKKMQHNSVDEYFVNTDVGLYGHEYFDHIGVPRKALDCQLYQRSADLFLGVPFNIASYALLTHVIAEICGMAVGEFVWTGGDIHIYNNHFDQVKEMLSRERITEKAQLILSKNIGLDFTLDDVKLENYVYHKAIKAPVAV